MSLTTTAHSVPGTLGQEVLVDSTYWLATDEPEHLGGSGSAPAPHELIPAAIAACVSTSLVMFARMKAWDLGQVAVDVEYDNNAAPRRFDIAIHVTGDLTGDQLRRLEKVARACPVRRSFEVGAEFAESIICVTTKVAA